MKCISLGMPRVRADAPVAMINASAVYSTEGLGVVLVGGGR